VTLTDALDDLRAAARKLSPLNGRIARNHARSRVMREIRKVRAVLDAEFPVIPSTRPANRKVRTPEARMRALKHDGWVMVGHPDILANLARAGVKLRVVRYRVSKVGVSTETTATFMPRWCLACKTWEEMFKGRKNLATRRAFDADVILRGLAR
jgi:hypothetical protein